MGCGFTNRSELELRLNEFLNFLIITQIKDSQYTEQIRSTYNNENSKFPEKLVYFLSPRTRINNPYQTDIINLQNDLLSRSRSEQLLFAYSLLFLCRGNAETLKTNFVLLKETFKPEFPYFDYEFEHLKSILKFYFSFISCDLLKAYKRHAPTISGSESLQIQEFEKYYSEAVIDAYISFFTEKFSKNFSLEKFYAEKIDYLIHENVRDELKNFYLESSLLGKKPELKASKVETPKENTTNLVSAAAYQATSIPNQAPTQIAYNPTSYLTSSNKYYSTSTYTPPNSLANSSTCKGAALLASSNLSNNGSLNLVSPGLISRESITSSQNASIFKPITENLVLYKIPSNLKSTPYDNFLNIRESALRYHNELRSIHSANFLFRNEELEALAQSWAETLANNEKLKNSSMVWKGIPIGENVAFTDYECHDAKMIVKSWYDERLNYIYSLNQLQKNCGSFTQLVWRKTHQFGFGIAQSSSGKIFFVANYFPAGNIIEEFVENVKLASFNADL